MPASSLGWKVRGCRKLPLQFAAAVRGSHTFLGTRYQTQKKGILSNVAEIKLLIYSGFYIRCLYALGLVCRELEI